MLLQGTPVHPGWLMMALYTGINIFTPMQMRPYTQPTKLISVMLMTLLSGAGPEIVQAPSNTARGQSATVQGTPGFFWGNPRVSRNPGGECLV